jgi:PadR family transcriptional regulator PadR
MMAKRTNPDFLNGVPELLILQILGSQPMYGYELVQAIRVRSKHRLEFGEGCVYPLLHRLEADGLLNSRKEEVGGRERIVYRLSRAGKKRLNDGTKQWREITTAIEAVLDGGGHAAPHLA